MLGGTLTPESLEPAMAMALSQMICHITYVTIIKSHTGVHTTFNITTS